KPFSQPPGRSPSSGLTGASAMRPVVACRFGGAASGVGGPIIYRPPPVVGCDPGPAPRRASSAATSDGSGRAGVTDVVIAGQDPVPQMLDRSSVPETAPDGQTSTLPAIASTPKGCTASNVSANTSKSFVEFSSLSRTTPRSSSPASRWRNVPSG